MLDRLLLAASRLIVDGPTSTLTGHTDHRESGQWHGATELLTPFSRIGRDYVLAETADEPIGLLAAC